jgi:uncharacterized protein
MTFYMNRSLPEGCKRCVRGEKSVLFVTGLCSQSCYFCPISEQKHKKDVVYINEWKTRRDSDIIKEVRMCDSTGAGITGGDPLMRLDRTIRLIRLLKRTFGKGFHIHLYTPLALVARQRMDRLHAAGLDEIRFHPDLDKPSQWGRVERYGHDWDVGVEIPLIPGKAAVTKRLIDFLIQRTDFLNLNELEISDTNASKLLERGFRTKDRISYGVKGSHELGLKLLKYASKKGMRCHYCTTHLKDGVQLRKRIQRRAKNARQKFDLVTTEGMLVRGAIYSSRPRQAIGLIRKHWVVPLLLDSKRKRILSGASFVKRHASRLKKLGLRPAIVEEYPTHDCMNVVTEFL